MLMENICSGMKVTKRFDLKGSLHKRSSSRDSIALKDQDFLDTVGRIQFDPSVLDCLVSKLRKDVAMLSKRNIMDYSLLVCECEGQISSSASSRYLYPCQFAGKLYFIALIDFFQEYNFKKLEHFWKVEVVKVKAAQLSSIDTQTYAERFISFVLLVFAT
mmetsp:Transcript_32309/g.55889  ORF Transcript_32309/g.55889 Transcript_32309/m.55889 type:complete len:160 (+) Transcript_32309:656-1135(+)